MKNVSKFIGLSLVFMLGAGAVNAASAGTVAVDGADGYAKHTTIVICQQ